MLAKAPVSERREQATPPLDTPQDKAPSGNIAGALLISDLDYERQKSL